MKNFSIPTFCVIMMCFTAAFFMGANYVHSKEVDRLREELQLAKQVANTWHNQAYDCLRDMGSKKDRPPLPYPDVSLTK